MAKKLKDHVSRRALEYLLRDGRSTADPSSVSSKVRLIIEADSTVHLHLPLPLLAQHISESEGNVVDKMKRIPSDDTISHVSVTSKNNKPGSSVIFSLNRDYFVKTILEGKTAKYPTPSNGKRLVMDFSSPNIAKPFHVGHLRSTIIGNFLSNVHEWCGYDVIRLNYLGDWGTQFGLLKVGVDILKLTEDDIRKRPLSALYEAYVAANKALEENHSVGDSARKFFSEMELGRDQDISSWETYRGYTVEELEKTYARLGVTFSEYAFESMYGASRIKKVLDQMKECNLLCTDDKGRTVGILGDGTTAPLIKSDGTSLYLTRDIAAAIDRQEKYKFSSMFYIVDASQTLHFKKLFDLLHGMGMPWAEQLKHIPFGRVRGMRTRRGEVVFLSDVLEHARLKMEENQKLSLNTRVDNSALDTADILGVSAVIMADLRHSRQKDYSFDWDSALSTKGETGVRLQYTHCRLCSLSSGCGIEPPLSCEPNLLSEPAVLQLVFEIARFDEIVQRSMNELEANVLSIYLFNLCNAINRALLLLRVKGEGEVGAQRLLLFEQARTVLYRGMTLLGLKPLQQM